MVMSTFYTAYWDKKYATNSAGFDGAVGASYSFSHSTFYGKQGVQPACDSEYVFASGTFTKGGHKP